MSVQEVLKLAGTWDLASLRPARWPRFGKLTGLRGGSRRR